MFLIIVIILTLLSFHLLNKLTIHKQQESVLNHLQIFRIAVGFSGKFRKIMTQQPIHALDGVRVCFASELFGGDDEIVDTPTVRRIKLCLNMANFICSF